MANTARATELLGKMATAFSQSKFEDVIERKLISAPQIPSSSWSMGNYMLMRMQGTEDARGYNQWGLVGRHVKKGAKAIYILVPMIVKREVEKDGETKEERRVIGFKCQPVFRVEDTEGQQLETYEPKAIPPLFELMERNGCVVTWDNSKDGRTYGYVTADGKHMSLSTKDPEVFFHELVHLYDFKNYKCKGGQDPVQEIVAELGSCVLCKLYGLDRKSNAYQYIASYVGSDDPRLVGQACFKVLNRVQQALNGILMDADTKKEEEAITA